MNQSRILSIVALFVVVFVLTLQANAHCDTLTGPVVAAARRALETGDVVSVLKWVRPEYEAEVRDSFARTRKVRILSADARELADRYFFETVVRLHRSGEGEPYTGLKATSDEPAIANADKAVETGDIQPLIKGVDDEIAEGIRRRFVRVQQAKQRVDDSLTAGREYVSAYVDFIHYVEEAAGNGAHAKHGPLQHRPQ